jgi:hypothetical protein
MLNSAVVASHKLLALRPAYTQQTHEQVKYCLSWLRAQGFTALGVEPNRRNPRIHIEPSPLCAKLEGIVRCYERTRMQETHYWVAIRFGCEIRWRVAQ